MRDALHDEGKQVEYVEYEEVAHSIERNAPRIDMLTRIGAFLDRHLRAQGVTGQGG